MKNKILLPVLLTAVIGIGFFTAIKALAEETTQNPMQSLVQKIADKFGLKKEDVQAVFNQDKTDRQAEREAKYVAWLDQLVKDGKITEAQKQLIIEKHKEMAQNRQSEMQNTQGKTKEERKTAMEANKTTMEAQRRSLEDWATQNSIDVKYLMGEFGGHRGPGPNSNAMPSEKPGS